VLELTIIFRKAQQAKASSQSYQSFTIKIKHKHDNYWIKIGEIGNYCQLKAACCQSIIINRIGVNKIMLLPLRGAIG
jgi:hypothetical protein